VEWGVFLASLTKVGVRNLEGAVIFKKLFP